MLEQGMTTRGKAKPYARHFPGFALMRYPQTLRSGQQLSPASAMSTRLPQVSSCTQPRLRRHLKAQAVPTWGGFWALSSPHQAQGPCFESAFLTEHPHIPSISPDPDPPPPVPSHLVFLPPACPLPDRNQEDLAKTCMRSLSRPPPPLPCSLALKASTRPRTVLLTTQSPHCD